MLEQLIIKIKTSVFGEITRGEKIKFPKVRSVYPENYVSQEETNAETMKAFNEWSRSINFGGMYVKEQY